MEKIINHSDENKDYAGQLNAIVLGIYKRLNYSLLEGAYIDSQHIHTELDVRLKEIIDMVEKDENSDFSVQNNIIESAKLILNSIAKYGQLNDIIQSKYSDNKPGTFIPELEFDYIVKLSMGKSSIEENEKIFNINLFLAYADHFLSTDRKIFNYLVIIKEIITKENKESNWKRNYDWMPIVEDKCNFLIYKFLYQFADGGEESSFFSSQRSLQISEIKFENEKFSELTKELTLNDKHFEDKARIRNIEQSTTAETRSYIDYYHLLRHYRKDAYNNGRVENLVKDLRSKIEKDKANNSLPFNVYAFNVVEINILNNELSSCLKYKNIKEEEIDHKLELIEEKQEEYDIKNYFPYVKICDYYIKHLEELLLNEDLDEDCDLKEYLGKIDKIKAYYQKAIQNKNWCKERGFLPYQLPYNECCLNLSSASTAILISSSFVLPIDYEKLENQLEVISKRINEFKMFAQYKSRISNYEKRIRELKIEIQGNEKRSIEIISVFAAIVLFSSGSIQFLKDGGFKPTFSQITAYMFTFGYTLASFIGLIHIIVKDKENYKLDKYFGMIIAFTLIAWIYIILS